MNDHFSIFNNALLHFDSIVIVATQFKPYSVFLRLSFFIGLPLTFRKIFLAIRKRIILF
jgi:hypothetical protein